MTSVLWTAKDVAAVTQGQWNGPDFAITGISIDTRTLKPGDLFVALKGPRFDGHDFIGDALSKGAAGILAAQEGPQTILVKDTLIALNDLGASARARSKAKIFAITGSVGKTSAKAMLATALSALGETSAAEASLNNHWGVPLSLARLSVSAEYAVFEIGMNHANEISPLSKLVAPHVAIITTIASAHIGNLGSIENIARAKAEIFHGMDAGGIAILPRDNEQLPVLLAEARTQGLQNILTFGENVDADFRLLSFKSDDKASRVSARIADKTIDFTLAIPGVHQAFNALATLGAVHAIGGDMNKAISALSTLEPVAGRGNRFSITRRKGEKSILVIDETHNASPVAVEATLKVVAQMPTAGRRVVILGDMLELGEEAPDLHKDLKDAVLESGADLVLTSGPLMAHLAKALPFGKNQHFPDSTTLAAQIGELIQPGDVIMVKGSRGSKMNLIVDAIRQLGQFESTPETAATMASATTG